MKKNKMMRIASFLLVAVLMSTCAISGTFAKYVTADSATDDARVAKWGITVAVSGNLFGKAYSAGSAAADKGSITAGSTNVSNLAVGNDGKNIVAPGTQNDVGMNISISGKPEVAYSITANENGVTASDIFLAQGTYGVMVPAHGLNAATDITGYYTESGGTYTAATGTWDSGADYYELIDKVDLADNYYPITWTVTKTGNATAINETENLKEIANSIYAGICAGSHSANDSAAASYTITWAWAFESNNDGADTILGHLMAETSNNGYDVVKIGSNNSITTLTTSTDNTTGVTTIKAGESTVGCLTVAFGISVTVAQVD